MNRGLDNTDPLASTEFATLMADLGPFENSPHVAIGVSGGADSLALCLLASQWCQVTALTVDHGLRSESRAEAEQVAVWLKARGIAHHILFWNGTPGSALQARARDARYELMEAWCHEAGVLHLLTAHHQGDQAETYLMRKARGSGTYGLAAMASISEKRHLRLLRPLLDVPKMRLERTLLVARQDWLEDPSNNNEDFERVRVRNSMVGLREGDICAQVKLKATERVSLEAKVAALLARGTQISPFGYAVLNPDAFKCGGAIALRAFSGVLRAIGGANYAPHREKLERAFSLSVEGSHGATLGGCALRRTKTGILVTREMAAIKQKTEVGDGDRLHWDGRFQMHFTGVGSANVSKMGAHGWSQFKEADSKAAKQIESSLPSSVRRTLPALFSGEELLSIPSLGYWKTGPKCSRIAFRPHNSVS